MEIKYLTAFLETKNACVYSKLIVGHRVRRSYVERETAQIIC